jgi:ABC-2 type transport system ATP-binding protein
MNTQDIAISVKDVKKSYKKVQVLNGVTFTVRKGSIFALLGSNGAGKTTAINILTTLLSADSGDVRVGGYNVATQPQSVRTQVSLTGQFAAVDDVLTGRENLVLIANLRHMPQPAQIAQGLLEQFDLTDAADRRAATYSGGMRRRLDIAMSLIGDPAIIFFDEPTTGLDPQSRAAVWETIKMLAKNGTTIFLTTQYLEEADQLADDIAILKQGKIVAQGTPSDLKNMLPGGHIELRLGNAQNITKAQRLLQNYQFTHDKNSLTLTVATDGSVEQMTKVLNTLAAAKIDIVEFAKKAPTLDDVFFKIVNDKEGAK